MFCTNCGASCAEGLTFCARCGSPLPAPSTGAAAPFPAEPPVPDTTPDPSPPTPNLAPGVLLLDRYSIIRELGEGGMGKVFLAFDNVLGVPVAVKVLAAHLARDPQAVERLKEEARLAMRLAHPHIVRVNHFEDGRTLKFLVMEYVDGETLARRLAREKRLPEAEVRRIGVVLSDALVHAHAHKVLHRDLKPSNVLLGVDGLLKLADFGIARVAHDSTSRLTGHVTSGTLPYMSPEQLRGQHGDARSDLYSLGVTLYELLAGRLPFGPGGYIPHQILHEPPPPLEDVSPQLAATVLRLLSKDPADRHATAGDLRDELDGTAGRGQAGFGGVATSRAVRPPVKPRAVAGTLAFIGLLFFLTWLGLRLSPWTATDHPAADTPEQHDAVLADKIRGYVFDCMQTTTRDVLGFKTDYVSTFDEKRGPTGYPAQWFPMPDITRSVNSCVQTLDEAGRLPPALPEIEAAVPAYRAALVGLGPLAKQVYDYYHRQNFEDDGWAKGKAMHAPLLAAFARFAQARKPFEEKVVALNDALHARRLARLEKDPANRLRYLVERSFQDAKKLVELAQVKTLAELDVTALTERLQAFEKSCSDIDEYVTAHMEATWVDYFRDRETDLLKVAKTLLRHKRGNVDFNREGADATPEQLVTEYNRLVEAANNLRFPVPHLRIVREGEAW